jgi:hypothetical protein
MREILKTKLCEYLTENSPDVIVALNKDNSLGEFLEKMVDSLGETPTELLSAGTPSYLVEEICMEDLTVGFRPSRFNYLSLQLEQEFSSTYASWLDKGSLQSNLLGLLQDCAPVFNNLGFHDEWEKDKDLQLEIIRMIQRSLMPQINTYSIDLLLEAITTS